MSTRLNLMEYFDLQVPSLVVMAQSFMTGTLMRGSERIKYRYSDTWTQKSWDQVDWVLWGEATNPQKLSLCII